MEADGHYLFAGCAWGFLMNQYPPCLVEHLAGMEVDAVIVAQEGSIDLPDGFRLVKTEYIHGKRVRTVERVD